MSTTDRHVPSSRRRLAPDAPILAAVTAAASALAFTGAGHAAECGDPDALTFAMVPT